MKLKTKNLTAIAAVIQVSEQGSFAAASRALGLSTSATSKAISRLEEELGVKLFHRTTRSVSLTPEGECYVEGLAPLLLEMEAVTSDVTDSLSQPRGVLRISGPAAFSRITLVPQLSKFCQRYPEVLVDLSLADHHVDLAAEQIDVAIRAGALPDNVNLVARKLFQDPLITCAAPTYLKEFGIPKTPSDLEHFNCLNFRNTRTGRPVPWFFNNPERQLVTGALVIDDGEAVGRAAMSGLGISQMPGFMAREALQSGRLQEVLADFRPPSIPFHALYLDRKLVSPRIRAFIDFLVELGHETNFHLPSSR